MYTKHRVLVSVLLLFTAFCISPLAAQIVSNTNNATTGLFTTDVDDFLDVNRWQELKFSNFFTAMQVAGTDGIGAGLAMNAGPVYLGFGYIGNFWTGTVNTETTEYGDTYTVNPLWRGKKTVSRSGSGLQWNSQVFVLLGTAPIGGLLLDVNFAKAGKNNLNSDSFNAGGDVETTNNSAGLGAIEAGLTWGKNFDFGGGFILKPNLGFSYNIDLQKTVADHGPGSAQTTTLNGRDDFFARSQYSNVNGGRVGLKGYLAAHAGLAADLNKSTGDGSLWLGYDFEYHLYDNQLKDNSDYWEDYNPAYMGHNIGIGIGAWYTLDRKLSLGWSAEIGVNMAKAGITTVTRDDGVDPANEYTEFVFGLTPVVTAGIVYKFLPDKFNLNGSIALWPVSYTYDKFSNNDTVNVVNTERKTNTVSGAVATTSLGFTWFITDGFAFDACVTTLASGSRLNVTQFAALLSYKR